VGFVTKAQNDYAGVLTPQHADADNSVPAAAAVAATSLHFRIRSAGLGGYVFDIMTMFSLGMCGIKKRRYSAVFRDVMNCGRFLLKLQ